MIEETHGGRRVGVNGEERFLVSPKHTPFIKSLGDGRATYALEGTWVPAEIALTVLLGNKDGRRHEILALFKNTDFLEAVTLVWRVSDIAGAREMVKEALRAKAAGAAQVRRRAKQRRKRQ